MFDKFKQKYLSIGFEERSNYEFLILMPNLIAYMLAWYYLQSSYIKFCKGESFANGISGVNYLKFIYWSIVLFCAYNLGKILLTIIEISIHNLFIRDGSMYTYKDKIVLINAIINKEYLRIFFLIILTVISIYLQSNLFDFDISLEMQGNLKTEIYKPLINTISYIK